MVLLLPLTGSVVAGVPQPGNTLTSGKQAKQLRLLGKKAVMHVYSYAPKTLEHTSMTSHFFTDLDACESEVGGASRTAICAARAGDRVDAECVAIAPPRGMRRPPEETDRSAEFIEP